MAAGGLAPVATVPGRVADPADDHGRADADRSPCGEIALEADPELVKRLAGDARLGVAAAREPPMHGGRRADAAQLEPHGEPLIGPPAAAQPLENRLPEVHPLTLAREFVCARGKAPHYSGLGQGCCADSRHRNRPRCGSPP